ncbi:ferrous iron transport protein B [Geobacter metallireducens RCH3]|uniref:Ferrous iron transport protein B n=1 Tax=Geobacter metallireducens (strain ATCC 53774 / DSM 7210 / GS-15) TaxID=269799 RepID=Q39SV5_GEOMG|nr:ferrous iron transport protein B [Geobacter metallireducens]ABB32669.1 ferrous iron transport protein B [Geobacter metallireducens GS-15]EHP87838.1 ferrous iron transport protein B [Geobacter metallireducens RCH3]
MGIFKRKPSCHDSANASTAGGKRVALVGNPNVGKSVLFNALTGAYVAVSNYPGTSVEVSRGSTTIEGEQYEIIDTPGMYSILPITEEERVAREILLGERPDVVLHVLDARNLERMLAMTIQLVEAGLPVVLVVNIMDEAERMGLSIDIPLLQEKLGIPVIGAATAKKRGLPEIREAIASYDAGRHATFGYSRRMEGDIAAIAELLHGDYTLSKKSLALLLLQRDEEIARLVAEQEGAQAPLIAEQVKEKIFERRESFHLDLSLERKGIVKGLLAGVTAFPDKRRITFGERLSSWAVHPITGVPLLFVALYYGLYQFVGVFGAGTLVDFLEGTLFEKYFNPWITGVVKGIVPWEIIQELFVGEYGVITLGLRYAVGIILPIVATFFLFFSILEDSGYFPRLALLVDRLFKKIGLTGRAVIPMVLGFGCDTMATMVTRTLETVRERIIATVLLALAIPCSAQLGVIMALLSKTPGALAVWGVCLLVIFLVIGLLSARVMPGETPMFYMELPPMRLPQFSNVMTKTYTRMQWYFMEILPLFIFASVMLWLGKITHFFEKLVVWMEPVMATIGLPKEAAVAFIFGFFRRDYGAAGLYDLQTKGLMDGRQLVVAAVTLTLFVPCVAQFLMMKKERGTKVATILAIFISVVAFGSGYLLNKLLLVTGIV